MDSAEAWLLENDPDYAETSQGWKHVTSGEYLQPSQEASWDEDSHGPVADLVDEGKAKRIGAAERKKCQVCPSLFAPSTEWHVYCSQTCQWRAEKRRQRAENVRGILDT